MDEIKKELLKNSKTIAVVGLSNNPERPSYRVAKYLQDQGYKIIPVNPGQKEILGEKAYPSLKDVPEKVDLVDIFRRPEDVPPVADEAIEKQCSGIWMQQGITNAEASRKAEAAGLKVVDDCCMMVEHRRLMRS